MSGLGLEGGAIAGNKQPYSRRHATCKDFDDSSMIALIIHCCYHRSSFVNYFLPLLYSRFFLFLFLYLGVVVFFIYLLIYLEKFIYFRKVLLVVAAVASMYTSAFF